MSDKNIIASSGESSASFLIFVPPELSLRSTNASEDLNLMGGMQYRWAKQMAAHLS
jgi:hypothetical protein